MPALPSLDLSQEHYDRVVAAFPGTTAAEKAASYRTWLINHLIDEVERVEHYRVQTAAMEQVATAMQAVSASLPPRQEFPPGKTLAGGTLARPAK